MSQELSKLVREAEQKIFGTKFCTSCQRVKPKEGGRLVPTNNGRRWKCGDCYTRMKEAKRRAKR